jgi:diketogulonate reductase-like aldo/keto reductase
VSYCPLARGTELFPEAPISEAAARHGKTAAQVVLRWHVQQDGVVAIPRSSNPDRIRENLGVFDFTLDPEEVAAIDALQSRGLRICDFEFSPVWDRD